MIAPVVPPAFVDLLADLQTVMDRANALGMWRTVEKIHRALNEARSEMFEAMPSNPVTIELTIGPVREQP